MNSDSNPNRRKNLKLSSILLARCPNCHKGKLFEKGIQIRPECTHCHYNFYPEPGFYVGAIAISFFLTATLTIPPMIILKILEVDLSLLIAFPFIEFIFVGTFLIFYSRVIWLHFQYRLTHHLDQRDQKNRRSPE